VAKPVILIVDDEEDVVNLWQRALIMEGFDVLPAYDGITALDLAESEQPALILLDIMMPMMSGYEVCQQVKSNPQTQHIPVLCVTSAQSAEVASNARKAGAQGLMVKPFTTRELVVQINRMLAASKPPVTEA
jgi:DNA-binding response OmpR family regulator